MKMVEVVVVSKDGRSMVEMPDMISMVMVTDVVILLVEMPDMVLNGRCGSCRWQM